MPPVVIEGRWLVRFFFIRWLRYWNACMSRLVIWPQCALVCAQPYSYSASLCTLRIHVNWPLELILRINDRAYKHCSIHVKIYSELKLKIDNFIYTCDFIIARDQSAWCNSKQKIFMFQMILITILRTNDWNGL